MKRWSLILAVVCAAAMLPVHGCSDDDGTQPDVRDDAGDVRDDVGGDAEAEADAVVEDVVEDDAEAEAEVIVDPCGSGSCPNDPVDTEPGSIGQPCLDDTECDPGLRCWTETADVYDGETYSTAIGGYCLLIGVGAAGCDPDVASSCPTGSQCEYQGTDTAGQVYYGCLDSCSAASSAGVPWENNCDCRDGYDCVLSDEYCVPGCSHDRECCEIWHDGDGGADDGARQAAEVTLVADCTNTCNDCTYRCDNVGCTGGSCEIGDACTHDSDCPANSRCIDEYGREQYFPGGMCTMDRCDLNGRECPAGGGCINLGSTADPSYMCFTPCTAGTEPGDAGFACRDAGEVGVPDAGDYSCYPVTADSWLDTTDADGFCYIAGNFASAGTGELGSACTEDTDCLSPKGLGTCIAPWDFPPLFCSAWCNENIAADGFCGGPDATTNVATGACFAGLCFETCDTPNGTLGANGCQQNMACYDKATFDPYVYVDSTATAPAGVCFAPCTTEMCAEFFTVPTTCNTVTGVCEL